jgi:hypothetical protein
MAKVIQTLGNSQVRITNAHSLCVGDNHTFDSYNDLGYRKSDGTSGDFSDVVCVEYTNVEYPKPHYPTTSNPNTCLFEQQQIEVYRKLYQYQPEDFLVTSVPEQFNTTRQIMVPNYSKDVQPDVNISSLGDFVITVPKQRWFSLQLEISENSNYTELPPGVELKGNTLQGIVQQSGTWKGTITSGTTMVGYTIVVPEILRIG